MTGGKFLLTLGIAVLLGTLTGLGVGGGSLLLLWLTLGLGLPPQQARGLCLLFFFPAAGLGALGKPPGKTGSLLPGILSGVICAALFSEIAAFLPPERLQKAMGILLLVTGLRELFTRKEA